MIADVEIENGSCDFLLHPIWGWFVIQKLDTAYLCENLTTSHYKNIIGASRFKVGQVPWHKFCTDGDYSQFLIFTVN